MSPVAASPPVFFARMRPSAFSCRKKRTLYAAASGNVGASGGSLPSSITRISCSTSSGVAAKIERAVGRMYRCSIAQGSTRLSVSRGRLELRVYGSGLNTDASNSFGLFMSTGGGLGGLDVRTATQAEFRHTQSLLHQLAPLPCGHSEQLFAWCPPQLTISCEVRS